MDNEMQDTDGVESESPCSKQSKLPTRERILRCGAHLFSTNGYTETSIRDIASAVGIKSATLYGHFSSKEDLFMYMVNDYAENTQLMINNPEIPSMLQKNPTTEGIIECMRSKFAVLSDDYYSKVLHMVFHEQHRNDAVRDIVVRVHRDIEAFVVVIFDELKKLNIIHPDADPDFWKKVSSSLLYTFPNRTMLGIGDELSDFTGRDLQGLLTFLFDTVLKMYRI